MRIVMDEYGFADEESFGTEALILCAECRNPFDKNEWPDHYAHEGKVYHNTCGPDWKCECPDCNNEPQQTQSSTEYPGLKLAAVQMAVQMEIAHAIQKFPGWPTNMYEAAMIVMEEVLEAVQAINDLRDIEEDAANVRHEMTQAAAMCERFLMNMDTYTK